MLEQHDIKTINGEEFNSILRSYPDIVPPKLGKLEQERLETIPKVVAERNGNAHLTKSEVQTLVDWKLAHGTFRPSLRKLVGSNSAEAVKETTRVAYALYAEDSDEWLVAVVKFATLRGIGPATASLLLSMYDPDTVPFFSDELFRWAKFSEGTGQGWDRKMKYSIKEYCEMYGIVQNLRKRLGETDEVGGRSKVTALNVEKVAYVLGRMRDGDMVERGTKRGVATQDEGLDDKEIRKGHENHEVHEPSAGVEPVEEVSNGAKERSPADKSLKKRKLRSA